MTPDRSHSDTVGRVAKKVRIEGGIAPFNPLILRSEISLFWCTSCTRDLYTWGIWRNNFLCLNDRAVTHTAQFCYGSGRRALAPRDQPSSAGRNKTEPFLLDQPSSVRRVGAFTSRPAQFRGTGRGPRFSPLNSPGRFHFIGMICVH